MSDPRSDFYHGHRIKIRSEAFATGPLFPRHPGPPEVSSAAADPPAEFFAGKLSGAANSFRLFADFLLGGLFVMLAKLHLAEDAFALHLPLQRLERLIDIVVSNENLHAQLLCFSRIFSYSSVENCFRASLPA